MTHAYHWFRPCVPRCYVLCCAMLCCVLFNPRAPSLSTHCCRCAWWMLALASPSSSLTTT